MTGEEAKAIIMAAFGPQGPTTRAAAALGISRRKLHSLYHLDRVPTLYTLALLELRRGRRVRTYADSLAELQQEAARIAAPDAT